MYRMPTQSNVFTSHCIPKCRSILDRERMRSLACDFETHVDMCMNTLVYWDTNSDFEHDWIFVTISAKIPLRYQYLSSFRTPFFYSNFLFSWCRFNMLLRKKVFTKTFFRKTEKKLAEKIKNKIICTAAYFPFCVVFGTLHVFIFCGKTIGISLFISISRCSYSINFKLLLSQIFFILFIYFVFFLGVVH